jgi:hypothetical protein
VNSLSHEHSCLQNGRRSEVQQTSDYLSLLMPFFYFAYNLYFEGEAVTLLHPMVMIAGNCIKLMSQFFVSLF